MNRTVALLALLGSALLLLTLQASEVQSLEQYLYRSESIEQWFLLAQAPPVRADECGSMTVGSRASATCLCLMRLDGS